MHIGDSVGPYRILGLLGEGGMGEVYRASDTQLNRDVALKILPELFARDPERLVRFTREAQALAALNHPNIAQIYGLEAGSGQAHSRALIMELVDGDDVSVVIGRDRSRWWTPCGSRGRLPTRWTRRTKRASSTGT